MLGMVSHDGIAGIVSRIAGAHLAHWDGAIKCCQSMLFVKGPGMPGQAWHQDERFIPTRDRSLVPTRTHTDDEYDLSDESYGFDATDAVPVEVAADTSDLASS